MKVRKLVKAMDCGVFTDYRWPESLPVFKDRVVIYGWNGCGKTTLTTIFRELETKRKYFPFGEYAIETETGNITSDEVGEIALVPIRVFNTDYVDEVVFTKQGELPPILYLGKKSSEKQRRLDECRKLRQESADRLAVLASSLQKEKRQLDQFQTDQGRLIKEALRSSGHNRYNNYDKSSYRGKVDAIKEHAAAPSELSDTERERVRASTEALPLAITPEITEDSGSSDRTEKKLQATLALSIESRAIQRLTVDPEVGKWVEVGVELHRLRESQVCLFCEHELPPAVLKRLEEHFNEAYLKAIAEIESLIREVEGALDTTRAIRLPTSSELSPALRAAYAGVQQGFEQERARRIDDLENALALLKKKRSEPFRRFDDVSLAIHSLSSSTTRVNALLREHNDIQRNLEVRVAEARARLEEDLIAQSWSRLIALEGSIGELEKKVNEEESTRAQLDAEIVELERDVVEYRPAAEELTRELASFLGRSELTFELYGEGYAIHRKGEPAKGLSEGEKSAIALLYFLKSLRDKDFDCGNGIVIIDDPISSLDSNALFCALGYLRSSTEDIGQLIFLTHNFPFFRELRNWLKPRRSSPVQPCEFYFLSCFGVAGQRRAKLTRLDKLLRDYDSEYQYLFKLVWEATQLDEPYELECFYYYPNVARRLLEAFFAFRMPDVRSGLGGRLKQTNLDPAKRERILRFLDVQSHNDGVDIAEDDLSSLAEAPEILTDVLMLMKQEDEKHYGRMCTLIEEQREETGGDVSEETG